MPKTSVDKEMIKNLELLLSMDLVMDEPHWESVEELENLDSAEGFDDQSTKPSKEETHKNQSMMPSKEETHKNQSKKEVKK